MKRKGTEPLFWGQFIERKCAFTLAEVLITLGIIGVVATLTIPLIVANCQKQAGIAGYKKFLSTLNQANAKIVADLGYVPECYRWANGERPYPDMNTCIDRDNAGICVAYGDDKGNPRPSDYSGKSSECSNYKNLLYKELKIVKSCNRAFYDGCTAAYKGKDTLLKEADNTLSDYDLLKATESDTGLRAENLKKYPAVVLADGAVFLQCNMQVLVIDVNGKKGPNKWGYDLFRISLKGNPSGKLFYGCESMLVEKGGVSSCNILLK